MQRDFSKSSVIPLDLLASNSRIKDGIILWVPVGNDHGNRLCLFCGKFLSTLCTVHPFSCDRENFCGNDCFNRSIRESYGWFFCKFSESKDNDVNSSRSSVCRDLFTSITSFSHGDSDILLIAMKLICQLIAKSLLMLPSFEAAAFSKILQYQLAQLFELFPHPKYMTLPFRGDLPESIIEIHDMFFVLLEYEIFPAMQSLPNGIELESKVYVEDYSSVVRDVLSDYSTWQRILWLVDAYSIPCNVNGQDVGKLIKAEMLPMYSTYEERLDRLQQDFSEEEVNQAVHFLESFSAGNCISCDNSNQNLDSNEVIENERRIVRVSQCASLILSPSTIGGVGTSTKISNPFESWRSVVYVLSPLMVPSSISSNSCVEQSCIPNIHLDVVYDVSLERLQLHFIANQDIYESDGFTFQFGSEDNGNSNFEKGLTLGSRWYLYSDEDSSEKRQDETAYSFLPCACQSCRFSCIQQSFKEIISRNVKTLLCLERLVMELEESTESVPSPKKRRICTSASKIQQSIIGYECSLMNIHNRIQTILADSLMKSVCDSNSRYLPYHELLSLSTIRRLRMLADNFMIKNEVMIATMLYIFLLHIAIDMDEVLLSPMESHSAISVFFAEVCLSLGITGFDTLTSAKRDSHMATGWTLEVIVSLYKLGLRWNPHHQQLQDLVEKSMVYEDLWQNKTTFNDLENDSTDNKFPFDVILDGSAHYGDLPVDPTDRVSISRNPILTPEECRRIINAAEEYALKDNLGWTTSRHYTVPTTDIPMHKIPSLCEWFVEDVLKARLRFLLEDTFFPSLQCLSNVDNLQIYVNDIFVVKYSDSQRYLPLHSDQSSHSLTIALNENWEYIGGGTYFTDLKRSIRPNMGHVVTFHGHLVHGGDPIIKGTRYIIAAFFALVHNKSQSTSARYLQDMTSNTVLAKCFQEFKNGESQIENSNNVDHKAEDSSGTFSFSFF